MPIQQVGQAVAAAETPVYFVTPPGQAPNIFASFVSAYYNAKNPWAMEAYKMRLAALDPSARAAALLKAQELQNAQDRIRANVLIAQTQGDTSITVAGIAADASVKVQSSKAATKQSEIRAQERMSEMGIQSSAQEKALGQLGPLARGLATSQDRRGDLNAMAQIMRELADVDTDDHVRGVERQFAATLHSVMPPGAATETLKMLGIRTEGFKGSEREPEKTGAKSVSIPKIRAEVGDEPTKTRTETETRGPAEPTESAQPAQRTPTQTTRFGAALGTPQIAGPGRLSAEINAAYDQGARDLGGHLDPLPSLRKAGKHDDEIVSALERYRESGVPPAQEQPPKRKLDFNRLLPKMQLTVKPKADDAEQFRDEEPDLEMQPEEEAPAPEPEKSARELFFERVRSEGGDPLSPGEDKEPEPEVEEEPEPSAREAYFESVREEGGDPFSPGEEEEETATKRWLRKRSKKRAR